MKDTMAADDRKELRKEFSDHVNMSPSELEGWLETDTSKSVGQKDGGGESVGHASGRRIIDIKRTTKDELTDGDYDHMQKVVNYVKRHAAQEPSGSVAETDWRYSLMNWGFDPCKESGYDC